MPIYVYRCSACGTQKEVLQKISDDPLKTCPSCQQETMVKQLTAAGFELKGGGWYVTDFRNQGHASGSDSTTTSGTVNSTSSGSDA